MYTLSGFFIHKFLQFFLKAEKQVLGYTLNLEKMQNAKKPILFVGSIVYAWHITVDTTVNICRFIIVSLAGPLCSSGLY
jgi:hypothetical protein